MVRKRGTSKGYRVGVSKNSQQSSRWLCTCFWIDTLASSIPPGLNRGLCDIIWRVYCPPGEGLLSCCKELRRITINAIHRECGRVTDGEEEASAAGTKGTQGIQRIGNNFTDKFAVVFVVGSRDNYPAPVWPPGAGCGEFQGPIATDTEAATMMVPLPVCP